MLPIQNPLWTADVTISDTAGQPAISELPFPRQALATVLGPKKWNDDVLICERIMRTDSALSKRPCPAPPPTSSTVPDADDATRSVIQGQHMRLKDDTGKGDFTDAYN